MSSSTDGVARAILPVFLRPIIAVFDDYEQYLKAEGQRDTRPLHQQLTDAKRHTELLVTGAVALQNQEDPGEVARLRERLANANGLLAGYGTQIAQAAVRHQAELDRVRAEAELSNKERVELGKLRKELEKSAGRLAQARATIAKYEASKAAGKRRDVQVDLVATCLVRALAHLDGVEVVEEGERIPAAEVKVLLGPGSRGVIWPRKS